jgi:hypothetical protein
MHLLNLGFYLLPITFSQMGSECLQIVVLEAAAAKAATPEILSTHCIPSAMSDDLKT